jgi:hypothetical protein
MMLENHLRTLILESLQEVNREKPINKQFEVSDHTKLLANGSAMDSLDYLNFSTCLEERLFQAIGREVDLSSLVVDHTDAFQDVNRLAGFLAPRLIQ